MTLPPAPNPCGSCPYRRDVPSGIWAASEYSKLIDYDQDLPFQPPGIFLCHQQDRDSEQSRLCAGWVGCHGGKNLLGVRLAGSAFGTMTDEDVAETVGYNTPVPLFGSGAEAAAHGMRDIECPDELAERAIEKIVGRRGDVKFKEEEL